MTSRCRWVPAAVASLAGRGIQGGHDLPSSVAMHFPSPVIPGAPSEKPVRIQCPEGSEDSRIAEADVVLEPDDSGSLYGAWGDPAGVRYAAALSVVDLMRRMGGGRVGVVHWGSEAPTHLVLPLTDVRRGKRQLRNALQIPPTLGGNNFPAALERAADVLGARAPGRIPLVIALTDGIEILPPKVHACLAALPSKSVHVLLIDHSHGCTPELEAQWQALPLGSFRRLDVLNTRHMAWQIADVITTAIGLRMPPLATSTPSQRRNT
jgi:von Willebrand factor type A domain